jgi:hypothetical protein
MINSMTTKRCTSENLLLHIRVLQKAPFFTAQTCPRTVSQETVFPTHYTILFDSGEKDLKTIQAGNDNTCR